MEVRMRYHTKNHGCQVRDRVHYDCTSTTSPKSTQGPWSEYVSSKHVVWSSTILSRRPQYHSLVEIRMFRTDGRLVVLSRSRPERSGSTAVVLDVRRLPRSSDLFCFEHPCLSACSMDTHHLSGKGRQNLHPVEIRFPAAVLRLELCQWFVNLDRTRLELERGRSSWPGGAWTLPLYPFHARLASQAFTGPTHSRQMAPCRHILDTPGPKRFGRLTLFMQGVTTTGIRMWIGAEVGLWAISTITTCGSRDRRFNHRNWVSLVLYTFLSVIDLA